MASLNSYYNVVHVELGLKKKQLSTVLLELLCSADRLTDFI